MSEWFYHVRKQTSFLSKNNNRMKWCRTRNDETDMNKKSNGGNSIVRNTRKPAIGLYKTQENQRLACQELTFCFCVCHFHRCLFLSYLCLSFLLFTFANYEMMIVCKRNFKVQEWEPIKFFFSEKSIVTCRDMLNENKGQ